MEPPDLQIDSRINELLGIESPPQDTLFDYSADNDPDLDALINSMLNAEPEFDAPNLGQKMSNAAQKFMQGIGEFPAGGLEGIGILA